MEWQAKKCRSLCHLLLCIVVVYADPTDITTFTTIERLKSIEFGRCFPRHGLHLLHWFVQRTEQINVILRTPDFGAGLESLGFRHYGNYNGILPYQSIAQYYEVGNLNRMNNQDQNQPFPFCVTGNYYNSQNYGRDRNRDRIIVRLWTRRDVREMDEVFITQHLPDLGDSKYDRKQTYRIAIQLLNTIRSLELNQFLQQARYGLTTSNRILQSTRPRFIALPWLNEVETVTSMFEIVTTNKGYARISWCDLPEEISKMGVKLALFKNDDSQYNYRTPTKSIQNRSGTWDTNMRLNSGLQVRLLKKRSFCERLWTQPKEILRGPEFHDANGEIPVGIEETAASLQLYTKDGKACARLYINKSFTDWKRVFKNSWVGFYSSDEDNNRKYKTYQWAVKFSKEKGPDQDIAEYDIYVYKSRVDIAPGVQVRFLLDRGNTAEKSRTVPWKESNDFNRFELSFV